MEFNTFEALEAYMPVLRKIIEVRFPNDAPEVQHLKVCLASDALLSIGGMMVNGGAAGIQASRISLEIAGLLAPKSAGTIGLDDVVHGASTSA